MPNYRRMYIENSYVFLTVAVQNRKPILIENINLLRQSFKRSKEIYNFEIFASVILPDHMHLILKPQNINEYPKIIFAIKYHFSRNFPNKPEIPSQSKLKKGEKGIWQRRYYEHTILSEEELGIYTDYVHFNPIKHNLTDSVKSWEHSSFFKFVQSGFYDINWGNFEDVKNISNLTLE